MAKQYTINDGYIKLPIQFFKDNLWMEPRKLSKFEALIALAYLKKCNGIKGLANKWQWSSGKVRRFLKTLIDEKIIQEITNKPTRYIRFEENPYIRPFWKYTIYKRKNASQHQHIYRYIPTWLRQQIFKRDNYTCHYRGEKENLCIDHKEPLSRGGPHVPKNFITACRNCNSRKHTKTYEEFMEILQNEMA